MKAIWIIARRELQAFFDSLIAYILLILFLGLSGFFTWFAVGDIFLVKQASLRIFFNIAYWSLFFFIPAITMRMIAEEKRSGTIELLMTRSVTVGQVVIGKFLGGLVLIIVALGFTLPYVITLANIGNLDNGAVIGGYASLVLMSAAYIGIGLFASSMTDNQIVAFLLALLMGVFFHWIFGIIAATGTGLISSIFNGLDLRYHFDSLSRGVIDLKDVVYFCSIAIAGILMAEQLLSRKDHRSSKYTSLLLTLGIIVAANLLVSQFSIRADLTEEKQYTMSKATKDILGSLEEPITVKAYFSEGLKPDIAKAKTDFREILQEYAELSNGNLVYEFLDPSSDDEVRNEALKSGVQPVMISVRDKNEMSQQQAFMGALIQLGEEKDVIPFIQPGAPMEYALTTAVKKLSVLDKPMVGLLQGHGEPPINEMLEVNQNLSVLYTFEPVTLMDTASVPVRINTLAIVRPTDSIPPMQFAALDRFLARGGKLLVAVNRVKGDLNTSQGTVENTGLETWLAQKGINVGDKFIADATCGNVQFRQQMGFFQTINNVKFPYMPMIQSFSEHPITKGLETVLFQFVSEVTYTGDSALAYTPIVTSSQKAARLSAPLYFDIQKQWIDPDFPAANVTLAGVLEGAIVGNTSSKMVVFGDGDFAVNGPQGQFQQQQKDNISLMVNAIDWLSDDTGLIDLRTKGVVSRPIDQLEEGTQELLKYMNFLLPILLVLLYGSIRWQHNKSIRVKRMEERYVQG